jgi:hypothetical protein
MSHAIIGQASDYWGGPMKISERKLSEMMEKTGCTERGNCFSDDLDFAHLRSMGNGVAIECLRKDSFCNFSFMFGETMYCNCPLIRHLYENQKSVTTKVEQVITKSRVH